MSDAVVDQVLAETTIPGLDISDALLRMNKSSKLYMRIVHSFIINMPGNLEELATSTLTAATLPDYAIKIHGAKGSCYGIGAYARGDDAKALECAAKDGDLETCLANNDAFIAKTKELIKELETLEKRIETREGESGGTVTVDKPDSLTLRELLAATQQFDIDQMGKLVDELTSTQYTQDGEVINRIKSAFDAFDYEAIKDSISAYL